MVNVYITQKLDAGSEDLNTVFTLGKSLFPAVKLSKNADADEYKYGGHGTGLDSRLQFSLIDGSESIIVVIVIVDNSSAVHIDDKNKFVLFLSEEPTKGLDNATIIDKA